jgi:hypothetical protein
MRRRGGEKEEGGIRELVVGVKQHTRRLRSRHLSAMASVPLLLRYSLLTATA